MSPVQWDQGSRASLGAIEAVISEKDYVQRLASLWSQESGKNSDLQVRMDNVVYMKLLGECFFMTSLTGSHPHKAKVFGESLMDNILGEVDPLILDADKFKQRAAGELVLALLRGSFA